MRVATAITKKVHVVLLAAVIVLAGAQTACVAGGRAPFVRTAADWDALAHTHACTGEHRVVELGQDNRQLRAPSRVETTYSGGRRTTITSGGVVYVVTAEPEDERASVPHVWRVTRDDGVTSTIGLDVFVTLPPEVYVDGAGAFVIGWVERARADQRLALIDRDRVIPLQLPGRVHWGLRVVRDGDRWLATAETTRSGVAVFAISADGTVETLLETGEESNVAGGVAARGHGGVAMVFSTDEGATLATGHGAAELRVQLAENEAHRPWLMPNALVPADDGWWIVLAASWQSDHFSYAPTEWRFVHVGTNGDILARARSRFGPATRGVDDVRLEDGVLRASVRRRAGDVESWFGITIQPPEPCARVPFGPCDARTWARAQGERAIADGPWDVRYEHGTHEVSFARLDDDGRERWRARVGRDVALVEPVSLGDRVLFVTRGLRAVGLGSSDDVTLHALDAESGASRTTRVLPVRRARSACSAASSSGALVGVSTDSRLVLFDDRGVERWSVDGAWAGCAIAQLADRILVAGERVLFETSGGPATTLTVHVLSRDGRRLEATHDAGRRALGVDVMVDEEGAWLVWADGWDRVGWRFDGDGAPASEPRTIATLYYRPATDLVTTPLGPALVWSTDVEQGVVPLCHDAREEPAR